MAIAPQVPPTPWTPTTSRLSSYPNLFLTYNADVAEPPGHEADEQSGHGPHEAGARGDGDQAGHGAARGPQGRGLPFVKPFHKTQERAAAAAARWVTTKALAASFPEAMALPGVEAEPAEPQNRRPVIVMGRLWGAIGSVRNPLLLPTKIAAARAEMPELM